MDAPDNPPETPEAIQPCSDAGLDDFLADVPNETERNNAIVALGHLMQGQPDAFGAHLAAVLVAHAQVVRAASLRSEKASQALVAGATKPGAASTPTAIARGEVLKAVASLKAEVEALRAELAQAGATPAAPAALGTREMDALAERVTERLEPRLRAYMNDAVVRGQVRVMPAKFVWYTAGVAFALVFILGIVLHAWLSAPPAVVAQPPAAASSYEARTDAYLNPAQRRALQQADEVLRRYPTPEPHR
jgi:hypothetical protein